MGYYINPRGQSKEVWLAENGIPFNPANYTYDDQETLPVCLVDNGVFTAAGIGYCKEEYECFADPNDRRPKQWFLVSKEKLAEFMED